MKRAVIALLTALTLLTQGLAWATVVPAMTFVQKAQATETAMPCHEIPDAVAGDEGASDETPSLSCCGDNCECADLCAGHAAAVLPSFSFSALQRAAFEPFVVADLRLSVTPHSTLRPPRRNSL